MRGCSTGNGSVKGGLLLASNFALARLVVHPHNETMENHVQPKPAFEPIEAENGEWYVRLSLPGGRQPIVEGFKSEGEAREWIKTGSIAWIEKYEAGE